MVGYPWKYVKPPATQPNAWTSLPLRRRQHAPSDPWSMMNALANSETLTWRKVRSASDLHLDCCPMYTQRVVASWAQAIRTAAISILYWRRSPGTPENGAHDCTGATTGVSFIKRRLARDTVPPMHPDWWWACAVGGTALQSVVKSSLLTFFLGFRRPNLIAGLSGWRTPD